MYKLKSGTVIPLFVLLIAASVLFLTLFLPGCSGTSEKSLKTPHGVVNVFVNRVLQEGNLKDAFELLSAADQDIIRQSPQAYDFIMGKQNPEIAKYTDAWQQIMPDLLEMVNDLVKCHARKAKEKDGFMEVGLEITYPSDYMTIVFAVGGIYTKLQQKYDKLNIDSLSNEDRDKIIWSIKNDLRQVLKTIDTDKTSTYIFPVKVVDEKGSWKINLELAHHQKGLAF